MGKGKIKRGKPPTAADGVTCGSVQNVADLRIENVKFERIKMRKSSNLGTISCLAYLPVSRPREPLLRGGLAGGVTGAVGDPEEVRAGAPPAAGIQCGSRDPRLHDKAPAPKLEVRDLDLTRTHHRLPPLRAPGPPRRRR